MTNVKNFIVILIISLCIVIVLTLVVTVKLLNVYHFQEEVLPKQSSQPKKIVEQKSSPVVSEEEKDVEFEEPVKGPLLQ